MLSKTSTVPKEPHLDALTNRAVLERCFGEYLPRTKNSLVTKAVAAQNVFQLTTYMNLLYLKYASKHVKKPTMYTVPVVSAILEEM